MKKRHRWRGVLLFAAAVLPCACSSPDTMSFTNTDNGRVVNAMISQELDIRLQTIGPGQYGDPVISSASVVFLDSSFPAAQKPGGPQQMYRFRAVAPGTADISIPHAGDLVGTPPFTLSVGVE